MTTDPVPNSSAADGSSFGDQNLQRLLGEAYKPEVPDPEFVRRVEERLLTTARDLAQTRALSPKQAELRLRWRLSLAMSALAAAACVALVIHALRLRPSGTYWQRYGKLDPTYRYSGREGLTPRSRPPAPAPKRLTVGQTVQTHAGEHQRLLLPDGSVLYVNQNSRLKLDAERQVTLAAGEVFAEVAPREPDDQGRFLVKTPQREVSAVGTKFAVRADQAGTGVVVTQGKVLVSGFEGLLTAGQQLRPDAAALSPAPRASHLLDWTREPMSGAEPTLVPESKYAGGAIIAKDPNGQEAKLSLRKYHIDVHIEDGFARTTIDQTYFNHEAWRMEGTFYFPLPPDASLSRLAMYVDGKLMEGGMAERDYARNVFEQIMYTRRDPALLEWVDGSTFKMRVFPLEGRQEKRIILSYTQRLPSLYGRAQYRFPAGHSLGQVRDWSFFARIKGAKDLAWQCDSHTLQETRAGSDLTLKSEAKNIQVDRDLALDLFESTSAALDEDSVRFSSAEHEGARYLMLRYRPSLPAKQTRQRRDWVFLFESSGDRDPLLARVQVDVIRTLLANAEHDDTFAVLTAGTRVHAFAEEPRPATPANIQAAAEFLEQAHLIGALDLGHALDLAKSFLKAGKNPYLVHVGSGIAALGERAEDRLVQRIPDGVRYVGVGIGKRWARGFMKTAAERTGGYFTQINPDDPTVWRAFDLAATLNTPRLLNIKVVDNAERVTFLSYATSLAQGEELCAVARLGPEVKEWPESVTVTGTLDGKSFQHAQVVHVAGHADYLPRTWAKLEIDRLLAEDAQKNKDKIVALSKAMYVMTPFTSLLVLENEEMYKQFNVDRGRKDHWALYPCPEKIPVIYEPLQAAAPNGGAPQPTAADKKPSVEQVLKTILVRVPPQILNTSYWQKNYSVPYIRHVSDDWDADNPISLLRVGDIDNDGDIGLVFAGRGTSVPGIININSVWSVASSADGWRLATSHFDPTIRIWDTATGGLQSIRQGRTGFPDSRIRRGFPKASTGIPALTDGRGGWSSFNNSSFNVGYEWEYRRHIIPNGSMGTDARNFMPYFTDLTFALVHSSSSMTGRPRSVPFLSGILDDPTYDDGVRIDWLDPEVINSINALGYYPPARALVIKGTSRIHTNLGFSARIRGATNTTWKSAMPSLKVANLAGKSIHNILDLDWDQDGISLPSWQPTFSGDDRIFYDLTTYAPGLNTSQADLLAVLEAEAAPDPDSTLGTIDPAARRLIAKAREIGWHKLTISAEGGREAVNIFFDGTGRFVYERVLPEGLREHVICDGTTLLHLYPELRLGARRKVTRFHRAEFARVLPWILLSADDLAHGADLKCIDERAVAILPIGGASAKDADRKSTGSRCIHLLFAANGTLAKRRLVELPAGKTLLRETYTGGEVKLLDANGKELAKQTWRIDTAKAPDLNPDTKNLVVLSLPWRTREQVQKALKLNQGKQYAELDADSCLALLAAEFAACNGSQVQEIWRQRFQARGDKRLGFYVLLVACGLSIEPGSREPLAKYLAFVSNSQRSGQVQIGDLGAPPEALVARLATFHDLYYRPASKEDQAGQQRRRERAVAFIHQNRSSPLGWAALTGIVERENAPEFQQTIADLYRLFEDVPGLGYAARYERARKLLQIGQAQQAQELFLDLYTKSRAAGVLPPFDESFRRALQGTDGSDKWKALMGDTASALLENKQRIAAIVLAWQCWQAGDQPLANELFTMASVDPLDKEQRLTSWVGISYLVQTSQYERARELLLQLLTDPKLAKSSQLWRLSAVLAAHRGIEADVAKDLEKALDLEYGHLPEVINLETVRQDYGRLLAHYQKQAESMLSSWEEPPEDFLSRIIRVADRWRTLDRDGADACLATGKILETLGANEMAWEYLTTPVAIHANESSPWLSLAQTFRGGGNRLLAERAYAEAFATEPTNAQILRDWADELWQSGKRSEARHLYHQLAEGPWQPRFRELQQEARRRLERQ